MNRTVMAFILSVLVVGCATTHSISPDDVRGPETWGGASNVTQLKYLYFSEQPDAESFRVAKSRGVTTVISLRDPSETDWNEKEHVEKNGMKFINIPIQKGEDSLDPAALFAIHSAVEQQEGQGVLLHCSTGNRAAAWLAAHLVDDHGIDDETALTIARKTGLTSESMEKRVRTYLASER